MNIDQANKLIKEHETKVVLVTYNILFTNDIVCGHVIEDMQEFAKSPRFRHKAKEYAGKIAKARRDYEHLLNSIIGERAEFFADANDNFLGGVEQHVEILYFSIKREFDRAKVQDATMAARLETTRTLCEFACKQFDKRMQELAEMDTRFKGFTLRYLRLTELLRLYDLLMGTFRLPCKVDLNTKDCLLAIDVISRKVVDVNLIAKAIEIPGEMMNCD